MQCKNEAASAHRRDDEGKKYGAMKGTELLGAAPGPPSRSGEALPWADEAGQENAAEDRQTEGIVEYQA